MSPPKSRPDADQDHPSIDEERMRRALGLIGGPSAGRPDRAVRQQPEQPRTRHRFVQDGEVPVVSVNGSGAASPGGHAAGLQAQLRAEQRARADAERSLAAISADAEALRTRLAHAEMARAEAAEALATERRARGAAEAALRDAEVARAAPPAAGRAEPGWKPAARRTAPEGEAAGAPPKGRTKPARAAKPAREPEPVKWWLPGYKAKTKAR